MDDGYGLIVEHGLIVGRWVWTHCGLMGVSLVWIDGCSLIIGRCVWAQ